MELANLRDQIVSHFNFSDLNNLCFDLGINFEELPGETLSDKARELINYSRRHGQFDNLTKKLHELRPNVSWKGSLEPAILIIGSGNAERVLQIEGNEVYLGRKHLVTHRQELFGGSGVDYTIRLGKFGYNVMPILSIGSDSHGRNIQVEITRQIQDKQLAGFVETPDFFCEQIKTQQTTIIVSNKVRTIFGEELEGADHFQRFVRYRINQAKNLRKFEIKAVMLGHILADSANHAKGEVTKEIIDMFSKENVPIFANFGRSQYRLGNSFWQDSLKKLTVFQLAIDEAREFFKNDSSIKSLRQMIGWFQQNGITAIITLEKMGAIGTLKDGDHGVHFARPYDLGEQFVDPTGAGDAFGAGVVSYLVDEIIRMEKSYIIDENPQTLSDRLKYSKFEEALERGRDWATYACTTLGAANNCPDKDELRQFASKIKKAQRTVSISRDSIQQYDNLLWLIDQAF